MKKVLYLGAIFLSGSLYAAEKPKDKFSLTDEHYQIFAQSKLHIATVINIKGAIMSKQPEDRDAFIEDIMESLKVDASKDTNKQD